jgi:hypothetical protein
VTSPSLTARGPIRALPSTYHEVAHLVVTEGRRLLWLNLLALAPLALSLLGLTAWWRFVVAWRGLRPEPVFPTVFGLALAVGVLILHECVHAVFVALVGHKPRFGAKLDKGVLYVTTDQGLFRRGEFIAVALAPLVLLSIIALALIYALPDSVGFWIGVAALVNASGAIGDLWMTWVALRYPREVIVRDEADGIRLYMPKMDNSPT